MTEHLQQPESLSSTSSTSFATSTSAKNLRHVAAISPAAADRAATPPRPTPSTASATSPSLTPTRTSLPLNSPKPPVSSTPPLTLKTFSARSIFHFPLDFSPSAALASSVTSPKSSCTPAAPKPTLQKLADRDADSGEPLLPLTWNLARSEDLVRMAAHNPGQALAVIRAQCEHRLKQEEQSRAGS